MKIAYLPPYVFYSPEFQHYPYFERVAAQYGCETKMTLTADEINEYDPDFVFVFGEYHAKLTPHPHYGLLQSPEYNFFKEGEMTEFARNGVYEWDGYLTTAKATEIWIEKMLQLRDGDRAPRVGKFFVAGDRREYQQEYTPRRLVYAGGCWDNRGIVLCKRLGELLGEEFEIYGNPDNWTKHNLPNYKGFVNTIDGLLEIYRDSVVLSISNPRYFAADIITTRMHESSSVGTNCITPWSPETMMAYGSSLYYYNGEDTELNQAEMIAKTYLSVKQDPGRDARRQQAHSIFNNEHSLTMQFPRLLRYHEYMKLHMAINPREWKLNERYNELQMEAKR